MLRLVSFVALAATIAACGQGATSQKGANAPTPPLLVANEDVYTIKNASLSGGPSITGSIQPERRADLRAEVGAVVIKVLKENGEPVRRGDLLVQLDDTAIRDAHASADAAARAASNAHEQARRQLERMKTLRASGMASAQQLDEAEVRNNNAQSDEEAAKTRVVAARQQMTRTEVRAPFDGIVSERKVSAGDTAQVGKELLKVIDPNSMRFEALISAENVGEVKAGQPVYFRVNGYGDQEFQGKVRRLNPAANPTTRQVEVLVDLVGERQPKLAGLYAEGRVATENRSSLTIPASAVVRDGEKTLAYRVKDNKLQKVTLALAERDARTGDYVVKSGLAEGDKVIRYPTSTLKDNQPVQASTPAKSSMAASQEPKTGN